MHNLNFRLIDSFDISKIANLLYARQQNEIKMFPFLNNKFLNKKLISERIRKLFTEGKCIGIGAFMNEKLVGYILGEIKIDTRKGRYVSVPYEGTAIQGEQSYELLRILYSKVSPLWLEQGCFVHSIVVPLADRLYYEALLKLSFAIEQVHAVLSTNDYTPFENVADVNIRVANEGDIDALGNMSSIISKFQNAAPVFAPVLPEVLSNIKEGFRKLIEEDSIVFIAEKEGRELGFHDYEVSPDILMTPINGVELCVAGVYHNLMGRGIGKKLMNESCKWLIYKGYDYIKTDWRISNLASSTFWPRAGFKPIAYRMARYIDINYSWANFNNPSIANQETKK